MDIRELTKYQNINENEDVETSEKERAENLARVRQVILCESLNGVKFSPMSNRLLEGKLGITLDEAMQAALQKQMFHRVDDVWLFPEMVANEEILHQIMNTLMAWLSEFGCFSISALRKQIGSKLNNLSDDIKEFNNFLLFLTKEHAPAHIKTRKWKGVWIGRYQDEGLAAAMEKLGYIIETSINAAGGTVTEAELLLNIPALDSKLLAAVVKRFLPHIFKTEMSGLICFSYNENVGLPEDFSTQLSETVLQLEALNLVVSETVLHTALSLAYEINFKEEYQITDKKTFRKIVAQYFIGETPHMWTNGVFLEGRG